MIAMEAKNIRNFCIISHIDHGKSTLADRLLELTETIEKRKMKEQVLDQMELERERGITIKMQPVRMEYKIAGVDYVLNLIDTPGHIDFSYEVSRALKAVEGAVLLVDATQGVQAQTIANVEMAKSFGLVVVPVINKVDLALARVAETKKEIEKLLSNENVKYTEEIFEVSAKTGKGVQELINHIVEKVPAPKFNYPNRPRTLIFDLEYSDHQGVIVYTRVVDGDIKRGDELLFFQTKQKFIVGEVGTFSPQKKSASVLKTGEIGYIVTNIKKPSVATVGDSVVSFNKPLDPLEGYMQSRPVVWAGIYPESQDDFDDVRRALERLRLSDSSLEFDEEASGALGRGFKCGFLGMLHLEIITERLKREFGLSIIIASPTTTYKIVFMDGREENIYSPFLFPDEHMIKEIYELWTDLKIMVPPDMIGSVIQILNSHEAVVGTTQKFGDSNTILEAEMPLRELMKNFFDELKSATSGYASLSYKITDMRKAKVGEIVRLDVLVAEEPVTAFSRVVGKRRIQREAERVVEKLRVLLPRAQFAIKIQAKGLGRILASRTISALSKNVTANLYGGDRTRKMKLWQKQKKGKKKLQKMGRVKIPHEVFVKMVQ